MGDGDPRGHPEARSAERIAVHPRLFLPWRESDPFGASRLRMTFSPQIAVTASSRLS